MIKQTNVIASPLDVGGHIRRDISVMRSSGIVGCLPADPRRAVNGSRAMQRFSVPASV